VDKKKTKTPPPFCRDWPPCHSSSMITIRNDALFFFFSDLQVRPVVGRLMPSGRFGFFLLPPTDRLFRIGARRHLCFPCLVKSFNVIPFAPFSLVSPPGLFFFLFCSAGRNPLRGFDRAVSFSYFFPFVILRKKT